MYLDLENLGRAIGQDEDSIHGKAHDVTSKVLTDVTFAWPICMLDRVPSHLAVLSHIAPALIARGEFKTVGSYRVYVLPPKLELHPGLAVQHRFGATAVRVHGYSVQRLVELR